MRIVVSKYLEKSPVARASAIGGDNAIEGSIAAAVPRKANSNHHRGEVGQNRTS
jgi:hypothetical protein